MCECARVRLCVCMHGIGLCLYLQKCVNVQARICAGVCVCVCVCLCVQGGLEQHLVSAELKVSIMLRSLAGGSYLEIMYHHKN